MHYATLGLGAKVTEAGTLEPASMLRRMHATCAETQVDMLSAVISVLNIVIPAYYSIRLPGVMVSVRDMIVQSATYALRLLESTVGMEGMLVSAPEGVAAAAPLPAGGGQGGEGEGGARGGGGGASTSAPSPAEQTGDDAAHQADGHARGRDGKTSNGAADAADIHLVSGNGGGGAGTGEGKAPRGKNGDGHVAGVGSAAAL